MGKLKLTLSAVVTGFEVWKNKIFWYIFPVSGQKIIGLLKNFFFKISLFAIMSVHSSRMG